MTYALIAVLAIVGLLFLYAIVLRPWLKSKGWAQGFFARIEPMEIALYKKSETMLVARLLSFGGFIVTAYDSLATFATSLDWTPVTTRVLADIPVDMRPLLITALVSFLGWLIAWLRKRATKPLEIVAAPDKDMTPQVAAAIAVADAAKDEAVAAVKSAA